MLAIPVVLVCPTFWNTCPTMLYVIRNSPDYFYQAQDYVKEDNRVVGARLTCMTRTRRPHLQLQA
jgi:hypothetical protein